MLAGSFGNDGPESVKNLSPRALLEEDGDRFIRLWQRGCRDFGEIDGRDRMTGEMWPTVNGGDICSIEQNSFGADDQHGRPEVYRLIWAG